MRIRLSPTLKHKANSQISMSHSLVNRISELLHMHTCICKFSSALLFIYISAPKRRSTTRQWEPDIAFRHKRHKASKLMDGDKRQILIKGLDQ